MYLLNSLKEAIMATIKPSSVTKADKITPAQSALTPGAGKTAAGTPTKPTTTKSTAETKAKTVTPTKPSEAAIATTKALVGKPHAKTESQAAKKPSAPAATAKAATPKTDTPFKATDTRKIAVLIKTNPHKEGSHRAEQFDIAKVSKTVAAYREAGGEAKYLDRWVESGHISLA